jgi:hypothetical protein
MSQLNYVAIYNIPGIGISDTSKLFQIWTDGDNSAYLTKNIIPFVGHLDRGKAVLHGLMTGIFNGTDDEIRNRIVSQVSEIQAERLKKFPSGTFLVFCGLTNAPSLNLQVSRKTAEFDVAFDAFDKVQMRTKFRPAVVRSLTAVAVSLGERTYPRVSKVAEGMYLTSSDSDKPTYSFTFTAGALGAFVGATLDESSENSITSYATRLFGDQHLQRVLDQFVQSLTEDTDEFRAFLAAWTALEMFVQIMFKRTYERCWFEQLRSASPDSAQSYFDTIQSVMSQRQKLRDKFVVIASLLDPDTADADIAEFTTLKKKRDGVFHGADNTDATYPTEPAQLLLMKYLRLHLDREDTLNG